MESWTQYMGSGDHIMESGIQDVMARLIAQNPRQIQLKTLPRISEKKGIKVSWYIRKPLYKNVYICGPIYIIAASGSKWPTILGKY